MTKYQKLLAFYRALVSMFEANKGPADKPDSSMPNEVAECWKQVKDYCSFYRITPAFARGMLLDQFSGDCNYEWARFAFCDLSPHFRDPEARTIFKGLLNCLGLSQDDSHLFVQMKSVRLLGKRENSPAVVTLIVDNFESLENLLSNGSVEDSRVCEVHRAEGDGIE